MPCRRCNSDFNLLNWKFKCGECDDKYCNKCLKRREGILYCEKCIILIKRPPDRVKLMELKPKDLQEYLNKHNISTYGLVEKNELVDLLCDRHIPEKQRRGVDKLTANFAGSVPNLKPINDFLDNLESVLAEQRPTTSSNAPCTQPTRHPKPTAPAPPPTTPQPGESVTNPSSDGAQQPTTSTEPEHIPTPNHSNSVEGSRESSPTPAKYPKLADFDSAEDLTSLSSKQLKILLTINRVDFRGCVEKSELLEKAQRLWEDDKEQQQGCENLPTDELCKLCMDRPLDCVLLECGHIATCIQCGKKLAECPICRQYVVRVVRTFKA